MKHALLIGGALLLGACGPHVAPPPAPGASAAPTLRGTAAMLFPVQEGAVPSADTTLRHWRLDHAALDGEIAFWIDQVKTTTRWKTPAIIDRALARSPGLEIRSHEMAVGSFQRAQVKTIGDPLFGDLRRLAAVLDANLAVIPVAAEYMGKTPDDATVRIATAVIDAMNGNVLWFGIIEGSEKGRSEAAVASAAQAFAKAFAEKQQAGEN